MALLCIGCEANQPAATAESAAPEPVVVANTAAANLPEVRYYMLSGG